MKIRIIVFVLLWSVMSVAQTPDVLFQKANNHFKNGKYEQAIETYERILASGYTSSDVYYNLGNAYYKLNEIAPSIYYYEKALLLDPQHNDAKNNLTFANRMTIDVIEPMPKSLLQRVNEVVIYPLHYNTWAVLSIVLAFATSLLFIAYFYTYAVLRKKWFFVSGIVSILLFLLVVSIAIKAKHHDKHNQPAIVFAKEIGIKAEPSLQTSDSFVLHEGAKVNVLQQEDNWVKISIADGKSGWLIANNIKLLR